MQHSLAIQIIQNNRKGMYVQHNDREIKLRTVKYQINK